MQTLWDEQVGGSQMRMSHPHVSQHWAELDHWYDGMAAWREPDYLIGLMKIGMLIPGLTPLHPLLGMPMAVFQKPQLNPVPRLR